MIQSNKIKAQNCLKMTCVYKITNDVILLSIENYCNNDISIPLINNGISLLGISDDMMIIKSYHPHKIIDWNTQVQWLFIKKKSSKLLTIPASYYQLDLKVVASNSEKIILKIKGVQITHPHTLKKIYIFDRKCTCERYK